MSALPAGWRIQRNQDGSIGIFAPPPRPGESPCTSDVVYAEQNRDLHELLSKLVDHVAASPAAVAPRALMALQAAGEWLRELGRETGKGDHLATSLQVREFATTRADAVLAECRALKAAAAAPAARAAPTPQAALVEVLRKLAAAVHATTADDWDCTSPHPTLMPALKEADAALAQAEAAQPQKPICWASPMLAEPDDEDEAQGWEARVKSSRSAAFSMPLYAAPQPAEAAPFARHHGNGVEAAPKQEAAALTDEHILMLAGEAGIVTGENLRRDGYMLHRSVGEATNVRSDHLIALVRAALAGQHQKPAPEPVARVPLTQEQIVMDGMMMCPNDTMANCADAFEAGVRFAERAHGIGTPQTPAGEKL